MTNPPAQPGSCAPALALSHDDIRLMGQLHAEVHQLNERLKTMEAKFSAIEARMNKGWGILMVLGLIAAGSGAGITKLIEKLLG